MMRSQRVLTAFRRVAALAVLAILASAAQAGPIFFPGELKDGKFVQDKSVKSACYGVPFSTITASTDGDAATVKVTETIEGPKDAVKTVCLIPLPSGARPDGLMVTVGNAAVKTAKFLDAKTAQKTYEAISRGLDSVTILSLTGQPAVLIPAIELNGKADFTIEFRQAVRNDQGVLSIACPMPATSWAHGPVDRLTLTANIASAKPIRAMFSPTHNATIDRNGLKKATVRVKAAKWSGSDDFRLCWVADEDALGLRVLTHREEGENDGYFMLLANPTGGTATPIDKDVIFVLDTSGSMRGEKIEQARAAIDYCVMQLNRGDRFNIITFGTEVASFRNGPVAATKGMLSSAQEFVENIVARGRTNIDGALTKALAGDAAKGRPRIMIFLTDGTPTEGELVPEKIVENVKQANTSDTRVFVMGVGHDVNAHLLDKLAELTDGSSEYVGPREEIDAKVASLYDRLSHPVLTNVAVRFGKLRTHSVYPKKLPALFKGSEVMIFGRFQGEGRQTFEIAGELNGKPTKYDWTVDVPEKPAAAATNFVAPLWAARNIGFLLQELRLHGPNEELIKEVVRLSKKFGIVTEYTIQLASATRFPAAPGLPAGAGGPFADVLAEAKAKLAVANRQQAGRWAVNQAVNDKRLQSRVVATREGNSYVDRRGRLVTTDNIRQIGSRTYYRRDGQWVDSAEAGKRKTRVVKLYSKEYYDLLRRNADFAKAQQLGWAVQLNLGNERIVVEKDGKQKDENLRVKQPKPQPNNRVQQPGPNRNQQQLPRNFRQQFNNAPNGGKPKLQPRR